MSYTANVVSAVKDPDAAVARITVEYFKDAVSVEQVVYRTGEPGTLPSLVRGAIVEYERKDTLAAYLVSPTLGPITPEGKIPLTQDQLDAQALSQKTAIVANLKQYVTLGILDPTDPSIAVAVADAASALQTVQANKTTLPPTGVPLIP